MKNRKLWFISGLVVIAVAFTLVSGSCDSASGTVLQFETENAAISGIEGIDQVVSIQNVFRQIAEAVMPAVVSIYVEGEVEYAYDYGEDPYFRWFFGDEFFDYYNQDRTFQAQGSGFIFTDDGYIFSNAHVVEDAERISITLADGSTYQAEIVGVDEDTDIAILKIEDDEPFPYTAVGDSSETMVGDWVLAIGNPFGLSGTYTFGVVSALEREGMAQFQSFIQTDTAVNPGNSGGPLVNIYGQVIGINSAIQSQSGGYEGISFAIPINIAKNVAQQIIEYGIVRRGYLGLYPSTLDEATRDALGLETGQGVMVSRVDPDTPAEDAGLQRGDIILEIDSEEISTPNELRLLVAGYLPDTEVEIVILRDEVEKTVTATLGSRDGDYVAPTTSETPDEDFDEETYEFLGVTFIEATDSVLEENGESGGVVVSDVDRSSDLNGVLSEGDLVIGINREPIESLRDLRDFESKQGDSRAFTFQIISDGFMYYRGVQVD